MPRKQTFRDVLNRLIASGVNGIDSATELGRRLHEKQKDRSVETHRRAVEKWKAGTEPEEKSIALVAEAFGLERAAFPVAVTPRARQAATAERVRALERDLRQAQVRLRSAQAEFDWLHDWARRAFVSLGVEPALRDEEPPSRSLGGAQ